MASFPSKPSTYRISDISVGQRVAFEKVFTREDVLKFAELSGDYNPIHLDPNFARETEFRECVVHGMLVASLCSTLVGMYIPGESALFLKEEMQFKNYVKYGEKLTVEGTVIQKQESLGLVSLKVRILNSSGSTVSEGEVTAKIRGGKAARGESTPSLQKGRSKSYGVREKVALVTGSSRGLGAAICGGLAEANVTTVVNYNKSRLEAERLCHDIQSKGGNAIAVGADLSDEKEIHALLDVVFDKYGKVDVVINNVYEGLENIPFLDITWEKFQRDFELQVKTAFLIAKRVLPRMVESHFGRFVSILSSVVFPPLTPGMSSYITTKSALMGFTRSLAAEYAAYGITANMVSPTMMETDLTAKIGDAFKLMYARNIPARRLARTEDVVEAVVYLIKSDYVNGINIPVTGGLGA